MQLSSVTLSCDSAYIKPVNLSNVTAAESPHDVSTSLYKRNNSLSRRLQNTFLLSNACYKQFTRAHQEMRYPNVTWRIILYDYFIHHWTTSLRHTCTPKYFWSNAYISNGRRFTNSALRILLLSTFRVSSINYSLACSLPTHTRSSANAEAPRAYCQKCSTYSCEKACNRWMTFKVIQGHCRCCHLIGHIRCPISLPL